MKIEKQHINKISILLFLLILVMPMLVMLTGFSNTIGDSENRKKTSFPTLKIKKPLQFLKEFKPYFKDNFGFRHALSTSYIKYKTNVLHESPLPSKVVFGKDGFMFLGNSFSNVINESYGEKFTKKELSQIKKTITSRNDWLAKNKIKYYIAVAPNKHTVYKENFPLNLTVKTTRKEQLITYIKNEINFDIIDLGLQFKEKKKENRLYKKLDSHWNDLGAFYAYQTLVDEISRDFDIEKLEISSFKIDSVKASGDISKMINYSDKKNSVILKPKFKTQAVDVDFVKYYKNVNIYESHHKNRSKKLKVLLFRDSFSSALKPFINETFGECIYIWSANFDKKFILKEKPDIVISEYIERYLEKLQK